ncbi:MAG: methylenetetrahydrofolate reductase [NAD(P)H] [Eubacteriaceae bacterium]|nr:methylenetetrahydrofolate reductase [NAD(P)H] [Eubacteriaceae bacterium]MDD4508742.1 methylenetetrahydrofolate reductase [NAD(P)H] [Eubacteriaceae bacterium]
MKLTELFKQDRPMLSFEVFPPKTDSSWESVSQAVQKIAGLKPSYMSVTYGAGGGTSRYTVDIAKKIKREYGVNALAHLTCVSSDRQTVQDRLEDLRTAGIENILALRGDRPQDYVPGEYRYAGELIEDIKKAGDFCIGGACYPECHPESSCQKEDIVHLKQKVDAGCEFLTTQMFFDNALFYNFMYKIREAGITVPIVAGIMPVTNASQVKRICELSGSFLPRSFTEMVDHFGPDPKAMYAAGIAYATNQIVNLFANGINHVHVYSMNKPEVARDIQKNVDGILH